MGQLHDRMAEDLTLRNFSPATRRNYLIYARKFAAFYMRSPQELGAEEIRRFLLHQIEVAKLAYDSYRQIYAALKFLYTVTLKRAWEVEHLPHPRRREVRLPVVLDADELVALFAATQSLKYRTVHDLLRDGRADQRSLPSAGRGHRLQADGCACASCQGRQGTSDLIITETVGDAARVLGCSEAAYLAVSGKNAGCAAQHQGGAGSLDPGQSGCWADQALYAPYFAALLRHASVGRGCGFGGTARAVGT